MVERVDSESAAVRQIDLGYIGRNDAATNESFEPTDEALIFLNGENEQTCHVEGPNAKAMAQYIVDAVRAYGGVAQASTESWPTLTWWEAASVNAEFVASLGEWRVTFKTPRGRDWRNAGIALREGHAASTVPSTDRGSAG